MTKTQSLSPSKKVPIHPPLRQTFPNPNSQFFIPQNYPSFDHQTLLSPFPSLHSSLAKLSFVLTFIPFFILNLFLSKIYLSSFNQVSLQFKIRFPFFHTLQFFSPKFTSIIKRNFLISITALLRTSNIYQDRRSPFHPD